MTITAEKNLSNNQSLLQNFSLGEEINEQTAEIISGGRERFTVINRTRYQITYLVDGKQAVLQPGEGHRWRTGRGGIIIFDKDAGRPGAQRKRYNLRDGGRYVFNEDRSTRYKYDIDLYRASR